MDRRSFITSGVLAAPAAAKALTGALQNNAPAAGSHAEHKQPRRNVLFICCDDLTPRIGCFGDKAVKTPNLDRLAQLGVRFEHNYCQYPLCAPSRSSLMTGLAPDTTQVWDLDTDFRDTLGDVVTLPQLFQRNGYFTARSGKIYHYNNPSEIGTPGFDDAASWQVSTNPVGYDRMHDEEFIDVIVSNETLMKVNGKSQGFKAQPKLRPKRNQPDVPWQRGGKGPGGVRIAQDGRSPILPLGTHGDLGVTIAAHASEGTDEKMTDFLVAESAIAMIEEHRNEPWFIGCGFFRPHVPFIVPAKYFDMYPLDEIVLPPIGADELTIAPEIAYMSKLANYGITEQQHREAIRGHYAAISFIDAQVGRLLDALERLDLLETTTIVFWADHGFMIGEHGQWEKRMLFEASAHVPLIIAGAGVQAKGHACRKTVEHLNIYPTLVELCGLKDVPTNLQGKSMTSLLANPDAEWHEPAMTQVGRTLDETGVMGYSLRTEQFRYTRWGEGGAAAEELYDYTKDGEAKNLAQSTEHTATKAELRARLEQIKNRRVARG